MCLKIFNVLITKLHRKRRRESVYDESRFASFWINWFVYEKLYAIWSHFYNLKNAKIVLIFIARK